MQGRTKALACLLLTCGIACGEPQPSEWQDASGYRWRELSVSGDGPGFSPVSRRSGIDFTNDVGDSVLTRNRYLGHGAGVALGDVDGDGRVDVFLARTEGCNALYRNLGGWKFADITTTAGVGACDRYSSGATFADAEGDGDLDLFLLATTGPNAVFVNDGAGRFTERRDLGLDTTGHGGTTIAMSDVDGNGTLDLFVANYKPFAIEDSIPPQQRSFAQIVREIGPGRYEVIPERAADYRVVMRPDMGGLRMTSRAAPDEFYLNQSGTFRHVPRVGAFRDTSGKPLAEEPESFGLGARFADLNGDGAPDLYVANDFEDLDEFWINDGRGGFQLAPWTTQRQTSNSTMGVDIADVNGDALPDIFEVDMLSRDSRRARTQIPTHTPVPKKPGDMHLTLQQQRNALFVNRGDGTFAEVSMAAGVEASGWSWATVLSDVDLDGWQDILVANGHLWDILDADVQEKLQNRLTGVNWRRTRWEYPSLKLRNMAFRNRGDLTFEDASTKWRFGTEEDLSHAMALADLDEDGDLDVIVNRLRSPALVLKNESPAPRVAVRLVGDAPNTRAVGAKVRLEGGAIPVQVKEVTAGGLYMSHSDYLVSFAMGSSDSATLVVEWRDGRRTTIPGIRPNREYEVSTSTAARAPRSDSGRAAPAPLFTDATAELRGHRHVEDTFDDWDRQFLLPNALSSLGPGVSWFDADRDGDEDLIIGTGKGGRISMFVNDGNRLGRESRGPVMTNDVTTVLGLPSARDARLIVGWSTWQARSLPEMTQTPAVMSLRVTGGALAAAADSLVGSTESATGPLAAADYDNDGDLDLFIGGRAIAMRYPAAASSGFFRNVNGRFEIDRENTAGVSRIGLVSSAVFADITGDGFPDLIVAREWDSIALFVNDGRGALRRASAGWGLDRYRSRWNGVSTGDLDGDGRLDIVATSWGRNTTMQADSAHPLVMLHGPFGAANEEEPLMARFDPRLDGLAPMSSYARVRTVMPSLTGRIPNFAAYANATAQQVLAGTAAPIARLEATTLDHTIFLNRGTHFEAASLPWEAQMAPAFYAGIADFDGDGSEDMFLAQNFSA
ncbi:MAG TPA: VCBS repeat-containing protein, partial [Gemmatimonadaceae bacterium]|nr:VCBS repeat-containing protein [Gemmatimonadaceae bacterium]